MHSEKEGDMFPDRSQRRRQRKGHKRQNVKEEVRRWASQVRSERLEICFQDKIPLQTLPINKTFKTYEDQCPDQCNGKRLKGLGCLAKSDSVIDNYYDIVE